MPETTTELMTDTREAFTIEPWDEFNQTTVTNVHPNDWVNPTPSGRYNLVALGAGTAGLVSAIGAAGLGAKVALVEKHLMGGDCLNVGCVPSKALISAGRVAADMRRAHEFGVRTSGQVEVDFSAVMERMRRLRARISHADSAHRFKNAGVAVWPKYSNALQIQGRVRLTDGERRTLAEIGRKLERTVLDEVASIGRPETILTNPDGSPSAAQDRLGPTRTNAASNKVCFALVFLQLELTGARAHIARPRRRRDCLAPD